MKTPSCIVWLVLFSLVYSSGVSSRGNQEEVKKISPAYFNPFDGGFMSSLNGCVINRLDGGVGRDGNMYAGFEIPDGSTITRIIAHIDDWDSPGFPHNPQLSLRKHDGGGNIVILATAINPDPSAAWYYEQEADIATDYVVQEGDFFDLIFTTDTPVINANYICGVEVFYLPK